MFESITSLQNERVKNLVRLRDGGHRRRQKRFLVEGKREVERAFHAGWPIETLFFCTDYFRDDAAYAILDTAESRKTEIVQLGKEAFAKVAFRQNPDGLLAAAMQTTRELHSLQLPCNALLVVLEGTEKPGNIGAVFRSANAAGCDALILAESVTDPFNPQTIRSSQGAFFHLPFVCASSQETLDFLQKHKIQTILTSPDGKRDFWKADMRGPTALVLGSEDRGLTNQWLENAESYQLAMKGMTDSLNLSAMAAVGLFEAVRQRKSAHEIS